MRAQQADAGTARPLGVLGIGETEERAYRWLLEHSGATVSETAQAQSLTPGKAQRLLDVIEAKGLVTHSPERPRRYIPASPDIALKALALRHHENLQRAEAEIQKLQKLVVMQQQEQHEQIVELITSRVAEAHIYDRMQNMAQHEFVSMTRLPLRVSRLDVPPEEDARVQREAQARGVRYRNIVDTVYAGAPNAVERMRGDAEAGEEIRLFSGVPLKLAMADRRIALIPLNLRQADSPSLVVRPSALLDTLYKLFEMLWERAAPISFAVSGGLEIGSPGSQLSKELERLIPLMAAGLNDKKIAAELGISMRTLRRRDVELMKSLNARTRFQAGWFAARSYAFARSIAE